MNTRTKALRVSAIILSLVTLFGAAGSASAETWNQRHPRRAEVNARLDNQEFRNRSTQYESDPDYPWRRLRKDSPGVYESYVDLEPGAWTSLKIEVSGAKARLFVNGAPQPCLVVNDLKHGDSRGKIALWTHVSSAAYFSNLKVRTTS